MDHIKDTGLCLADVARFWAREPTVVYTEDEIVAILVQAVWRGDLLVEPPAGHVPRDGDYRYSLLKAVAGIDSHPGLLFVRPGEPVAPAVTDLPDGGALVDPRERIEWVAVGAEPDEATAEATFSTLASVTVDAYDAATTVPILRTLTIERDALRQFCEIAGYALPTFWFEKGAVRTSAAAVTRCRTWFKTVVDAGDYPGPKPEVRALAMRKFKGLSARAFDRVWKEMAPKRWKQSGRRIGSLRRPRSATP
ncbi:hypothetical protein [Alsobacter sp. R-9]